MKRTKVGSVRCGNTAVSGVVRHSSQEIADKCRGCLVGPSYKPKQGKIPSRRQR